MPANDFLVNNINTGRQGESFITTLANGSFVITWTSGDNGVDNDVRARVFAADGRPISAADILVSTTNDSNQTVYSITSLANGGFVISWESFENAEFGNIRARVFAADGTAVNATDILVSTSNADFQVAPQITALDGGGFVAVWASADNGVDRDIRGRVFAADGTPVNGSDFLVSTSNADYQQFPEVTALSTGGFAVTWETYVNAVDRDVYGRVFAADGTPVNNSDYIFSTSNAWNQRLPEITTLANGGFVATWQSLDNGANDDIRAQVFDANGTPIGGTDFLVSTTNNTVQERPEITALANGGFVVTWISSDNMIDQDIRARVFAADGTPVNANDFRVNTTTPLNQLAPQITALSNGGFVVTWYSYLNFQATETRARIYQADGTPLQATDILVNTTSALGHDNPQITALDNGGFVITWSTRTNNSNGGDVEIRAQIFQADGTPGSTVILGTSGNDTLVVTPALLTGITTIDGGAGTDRLSLSVSGSYDLSGITLSSIEEISGSAGNDTIILGAGNYSVLSGLGDDAITADVGNQLFSNTGGVDTLYGFRTGGTDDVIDLTAFTSFTSHSAVLAASAQTGSDVTITLGSGTSFVLANITLSSLTDADFLLGPTTALSLTGTTGANTLNGMSGNDTIDGRGGGDTIRADSGDDTVYYYASDNFANVFGGNGTDTLLIVGGSAPTSLNLVAQGFEQARHLQSDTGNTVSWNTITDVYNATWQIVTSDRINDDNSRRVTTYDRANTQTWSLSEEDYNTNSARYELRTYYDDSTRRTTGYDVNNAQTYGTYEEDYNAAGLRTALRTYYDDGTRRTTGYDTGSLTWSSYEEDYNAAGQRVALRTYNDDGTRRTTQWDPANGQTWSLIEEYFDAAGQRTRQITDYDDGDNTRARLDTVWDVDNTQAWSVQTTQTNNLSAVVRVYGTLDNGSAFG